MEFVTQELFAVCEKIKCMPNLKFARDCRNGKIQCMAFVNAKLITKNCAKSKEKALQKTCKFALAEIKKLKKNQQKLETLQVKNYESRQYLQQINTEILQENRETPQEKCFELILEKNTLNEAEYRDFESQEKKFLELYEIFKSFGILQVIKSEGYTLGILFNENIELKYLGIVAFHNYDFISCIARQISQKIYEKHNIESCINKNNIIIPELKVNFEIVTNKSDEFLYENYIKSVIFNQNTIKLIKLCMLWSKSKYKISERIIILLIKTQISETSPMNIGFRKFLELISGGILLPGSPLQSNYLFSVFNIHSNLINSIAEAQNDLILLSENKIFTIFPIS